MNKVILFLVLSLTVSTASSLEQDRSFPSDDIHNQSFLPDMISNVLKANKPKNFVLKQAAPTESTCALQSYTEPSESLEAAIPHVVEHMNLQDHQETKDFIKIFENDPTSKIEKWHIFSYLNHSNKTFKVAFFRYCTADKVLNTHYVTGPLQSDIDKGEYLAHFESEFGTNLVNTGKVFIFDHGDEEPLTVLLPEFREVIYKSLLKLKLQGEAQQPAFIANFNMPPVRHSNLLRPLIPNNLQQSAPNVSMLITGMS